MNLPKKPWEEVTEAGYFRAVMLNLVDLGFGPKEEGKAHVRFGSTGIGHSPNYQIEIGESGITCFLGRNHKQALDDEFESGNLSDERFSYSEVRAMLARVLDEVPK